MWSNVDSFTGQQLLFLIFIDDFKKKRKTKHGYPSSVRSMKLLMYLRNLELGSRTRVVARSRHCHIEGESRIQRNQKTIHNKVYTSAEWYRRKENLNHYEYG